VFQPRGQDRMVCFIRSGTLDVDTWIGVSRTLRRNSEKKKTAKPETTAKRKETADNVTRKAKTKAMHAGNPQPIRWKRRAHPGTRPKNIACRKEVDRTETRADSSSHSQTPKRTHQTQQRVETTINRRCPQSALRKGVWGVAGRWTGAT